MSVNWASSDLGAKVVDVSSESPDCLSLNALDWNQSSMWMTEEGLPQWISISLKDLNSSGDTVIRTVGWNCWQSYSTNPRKVSIHVSSDGSKYKLWDSFIAPTQRKGDQLFCVAPISTAIFPYVAFEISRTFGGTRTYMNRILLFSEEYSMSPVPMRQSTAGSGRTFGEDVQPLHEALSASEDTQTDLSHVNFSSLHSPKYHPQQQQQLQLQQQTTSFDSPHSLSQSYSDDSSEQELKPRNITSESPLEFRPVFVQNSPLYTDNSSTRLEDVESRQSIGHNTTTCEDITLRPHHLHRTSTENLAQSGNQTSAFIKPVKSADTTIRTNSGSSSTSDDSKLLKAIDNVQTFIRRAIIATEGKLIDKSQDLKTVPDLKSPLHPQPINNAIVEQMRDGLDRTRISLLSRCATKSRVLFAESLG